ncbi:autotransporter outer membrane beta-barrel domain-containing protein [Jiella sp. M17.18]|uniref:autotransporter outer membrane beta-barrel domain-containing protein n=1 Tax=Jiella sp. M17.18 TaxID=3234247 RepID=UPI0034DEBD42
MLAGLAEAGPPAEADAASLSAIAGNSDLTGSFSGQNDIASRVATTQLDNFGNRLSELRGDTCQRISVDLSLTQNQAEHDAWDTLITSGDAPPRGANPTLQSKDSATDRALCGGWETHAWANGHVTFGSLAEDTPRLGFDYVATGISSGFDLRQSADLSVGGGVGLDTDETVVGSNGTRIGASAVSVAGYASYHPKESSFVEGLAGIGALQLDNARAASEGDGTEYGHRNGGVAFGQVSVGLEQRVGDATLQPYGRLAVDAIHLRPYSEAGDAEALNFSSQSQVSLRSSIGLKARYLATRLADWFSVSPWAEVEAGRDRTFSSDGAISLIADPAANHHRITDPSTGNRRLSVGIGTDITFGKSFDVALSYRGTFETSDGTSQQLALTSKLPF